MTQIYEHYRKQRLMARCKIVKGGTAEGTAPASFWMCVESEFITTRSTAPTQLDKVVTCAIPIKAGDPVGFIGLYETAKKGGGKISKYQVHLEIFSTDQGVKRFLQNKAGVQQGTQYLKLAKDTQLHTSDGKTPPAFTASNQTLGSDCIVTASGCKKIKDASDKEWYELTLNDQGTTRNGCVKASQTETLSQHDWEKLGFKTIEAPMDFDGHLDTMASQPFFKQLYKTVTGTDAPPDRNKIRDGLTGAGHREQWSKIVAYHPSEWKASSSSSLWSVLGLMLHKSPARHAHEKERIDNSIWWDEVVGSVPELNPNGVAWHWHPVGALGQVMVSGGLITKAMLKAAAPSISAEYSREILPMLNEFAVAYEVNTDVRIAHFLSQIGHESEFRATSENLNYSIERMRKVFGCKGGQRNYDEDCDDCTLGRARDKLWTHESHYAHKPDNLADCVYSSRLGNGDEDSGDGYRYRGRGLLQITGKDNYRAFSKLHKERVPGDNVDFVINPDLVVDSVRYAIESAFGWWHLNKINNKIDAMYEHFSSQRHDDNISLVTRAVNGGLNGYQDRSDRFYRVLNSI